MEKPEKIRSIRRRTHRQILSHVRVLALALPLGSTALAYGQTAKPAPQPEAAPPKTTEATPKGATAPPAGPAEASPPTPNRDLPGPYGPPPGYGRPPAPPGEPVPPPGGDYGPYPEYRYPEPAARAYHPTRYRDFEFHLGFGMGAMGLRDAKNGFSTETAGAFNLRAGFGLAEKWLMTVGIDQAFSSTPVSSVSAWTLGLGVQTYILQRLYGRAAFGIHSIRETQGGTDRDEAFGASGPALLGGVGVEAVQGISVALVFEATAQVARVARTTWVQALIGMGVHFY